MKPTQRTARPGAAFSWHVTDGALNWHVEANTAAELDGWLQQARVARLVSAGLGDTVKGAARRLEFIDRVLNRLLDARVLLTVLEQWTQTPWWALDPNDAQTVAGSSPV